MNKSIFINKREWKNYNDSELEDYIAEVFKYYREKGFPYFPTDHEFRRKEFQKFMNSDISRILSGDILKQNMNGLSLCWSYMPHSFDVPCNNLRTPLATFNDDTLLLQVIRKRIRFGDNMSDNGLRKMLKMFTGTQGVSNFRPTSAAAIYNLYGKGKVVWDMSCGYGGRLLGAIKAGVKSYIGTEPCLKTWEGLQNICDDFKPEFKHTIHCLGAEDFTPEKKSLDLCFTSPPYFDTEKYSNEPTQSYVKFKTFSEWLEGFIYPMIKKCHHGLSDEGKLILNIANTKSAPELVDKCKEICLESGFTLEKTIQYALSCFKTGVKFKYEPVYVFKKRF